MIKFNNYPPETPEDIAWTDMGDALAHDLIGENDENAKYLGASIGSLLAAAVVCDDETEKVSKILSMANELIKPNEFDYKKEMLEGVVSGAMNEMELMQGVQV